jgi:hypothetical protein
VSDWQVGDLAVRVKYDDPERWYPMGTITYGSTLGEIRRVDGVVLVAGEIGLIFADNPSPHRTRAWSSLQWRKIRPDEREACEPEFITLLKRSKRKVDA